MSHRVLAILIDLSGTLHIEDEVLPGAVNALNRLRKTNFKLKFVTNTTQQSKRALCEHLNHIGFAIQKEELFTSLSAARHILVRNNLRPYFLISDEALEEFEGISTENPNAVVVGLAPQYFEYAYMNQAFRHLLDGASLIAVHKARYYKRKDGLALGPGAFVSGLEYAADVKATIVGKPEASFFSSALQCLGCKPEEAIMIGDDVRSDVEGAMAAGLRGILVRTGKYRSGDEGTIEPPPTHTADTFSAAVDYILENFSAP